MSLDLNLQEGPDDLGPRPRDVRLECVLADAEVLGVILPREFDDPNRIVSRPGPAASGATNVMSASVAGSSGHGRTSTSTTNEVGRLES